MARINENYLKLPGNYLFAEVARRVGIFQKEQPEAALIRLGIGDVTRPLPSLVLKAMHKAVDEMGDPKGFHGYGPAAGYAFLRQSIIEAWYTPRGVNLCTDELFISDGAKSDLGHFQHIMGTDNLVAVTDPVYPVYVDSNVMAGRTGELGPGGVWSKLVYLPCTAANNFIPALPATRPDIIYLCLPNNPTGTTLTKAQLQEWVDYARANECLLLFDAAYEAYIREPAIPHSIYELEGAREVAVEFRSFSKTAGFTGVRCSLVVVPKELRVKTAAGELVNLNAVWSRHQHTKYNGCAYVSQRAAEAACSPEGQAELANTVDYYMQNADTIRTGLEQAGFEVYGGRNAPYIWVKTPETQDSWAFFEVFLRRFAIVGTPGAGFGPSGEGYFRLTAFGTHESTKAAMDRIGAAGHWSSWAGSRANGF